MLRVRHKRGGSSTLMYRAGHTNADFGKMPWHVAVGRGTTPSSKKMVEEGRRGGWTAEQDNALINGVQRLWAFNVDDSCALQMIASRGILKAHDASACEARFCALMKAADECERRQRHGRARLAQPAVRARAPPLHAQWRAPRRPAGATSARAVGRVHEEGPRLRRAELHVRRVVLEVGAEAAVRLVQGQV